MPEMPRLHELCSLHYLQEEEATRAGEECLKAFPLGPEWRVETQEFFYNDTRGFVWWISQVEVDLGWEITVREHRKTGELYHVASVDYQECETTYYVSDLGPWEAVAGLYERCRENAEEFLRRIEPGAAEAVRRLTLPEPEVDPVTVWEHLKEE